MMQEETRELGGTDVTLTVELLPVAAGLGPHALSSDRVLLSASAGGESLTLAELDGRYLSAETAASFTGRVIGLYAVTGAVAFDRFSYRGSED